MELSKVQSKETASSAVRFIEEIAIIIAAKNLTPTILSLDFLKSSGIIPQDWKPIQQPILNPNFAQLAFAQGINLVAQPGTVTIREAVGDKAINEFKVPQIASKYIEKLPHAEYLRVSFSPKIIVPFPGNPQAVQKYFTKTLLAQGSWQEIGVALLQAGVNLVYQLERCQLSINISQARLQSPQQNPVPALLFSGSFNYNLATNNQQQRLSRLTQSINYWQTDFKTFRGIVTQKFLVDSNLGGSSQSESVFPSGTL